MSYRVIVLPGDGIGPKVTTEPVRVLDWFHGYCGLDVAVRHELCGAVAYHTRGAVIANKAFTDLAEVEVVLFGTTGGSEVDEIPPEARRKGNLLRICQHMAVFANLRPVIGYDELAGAVPLELRRLHDA